MDVVDKVLNIVYVIVGSLLIYWITNKNNKNEYRMKMMIETGNEVLIPFCSNIEALIGYIESSEKKLNFNMDKKFLEKSYESTKFLEAKKRVYLDKQSRKLLLDYENDLKQFQKDLKEDVNKVFDIIKQELENILLDFSDKYPMSYGFSFEEGSKEEIENAIINCKQIEGQFFLEEIDIIYNDDPDNYGHENFYLGNDFYIKIWGPIQTDYIGVGDLELSFEQKESLRLFEYINDNSQSINSKINNFIQSSSIKLDYMEILKSLNLIKNHLVNEIDKIFDLG